MLWVVHHLRFWATVNGVGDNVDVRSVGGDGHTDPFLLGGVHQIDGVEGEVVAADFRGIVVAIPIAVFKVLREANILVDAIAPGAERTFQCPAAPMRNPAQTGGRVGSQRVHVGRRNRSEQSCIQLGKLVGVIDHRLHDGYPWVASHGRRAQIGSGQIAQWE